MPNDPPKPLWGGSFVDESEPPHPDVVARWEFEDEPEDTPPDREPQPRPEPPPAPRERPRVPFTLAVVVSAAFVALMLAQLTQAGSYTVKTVPSGWGDIPMRCETARFERDVQALEIFRCRAVGGGLLPEGIYRSPDSVWTSDITRRDARENQIQISPDGDLVGWAAY